MKTLFFFFMCVMYMTFGLVCVFLGWNLLLNMFMFNKKTLYMSQRILKTLCDWVSACYMFVADFFLVLALLFVFFAVAEVFVSDLLAMAFWKTLYMRDVFYLLKMLKEMLDVMYGSLAVGVDDMLSNNPWWKEALQGFDPWNMPQWCWFTILSMDLVLFSMFIVCMKWFVLGVMWNVLRKVNDQLSKR